MASDLAAQRAAMRAAVNATRPQASGPSSSMTDEQLMRLLDHPDPKVRDAARRQLDARRQTGSTTADLANETRPVPEVKTEDNGWKNGAFNWDLAKQEMAAQRERADASEEARRAEWDNNYGDGTYDYRGAAGAVRRDRGLRQPASKQEQLDAMRAAQIADLEQQRQDEAGVQAHNARVAGLVGGGTPADLDPVEAAATPVTPDPPVRGKKPTSKPRSGQYGRTVPGPVAVDGSPVAAPEAFASQEEADAYNTRRVLSQDEAAPVTVNPLDAPQVGPDGMAASQRDIDMRKRGFVPVYGQDGSVTYMLEAPAVPGTRGAPGRRGDRPELTRQSLGVNDPPVDMYEATVGTDAVPGPLGPQSVYRPTDKYKKEVATAQERREVNRLIESSGLPAETVLGAYATDGIKGARMVANAAKAEAGARRREAVVRQAQLTQRPANILSNPTADDWTRRLASEALLRSGRPGATPLDVQGQQMANMQRVLQQFATAGLGNLQNQAGVEAAERARRETQEAEWRKTGHGAAAWSYGGAYSSDVAAKRERFITAARGAGAPEAWIQAEADAAYPLPADPADGRVDGRQVNPQAMF
jgi:hypothetical protein